MNIAHSLALLVQLAAVASFIVLSWRRPQDRFDLALGGLAFGVCGAIFLGCHAGVIQGTAEAVVAGPIDAVLHERILAEAFSESAPWVVAGLAALVPALAWFLYAASTRSARLAALGVAVVVLAPLTWLGTRGIGFHERFMRETFAELPHALMGGSDDACFALGGAIRQAGGIEAATKIDPRSRQEAQSCIEGWLTAIDEDGADARRLELHASVAHQLFVLRGNTPLDLVAASPLLVDDAQRREVARRQALVAAE